MFSAYIVCDSAGERARFTIPAFKTKPITRKGRRVTYLAGPVVGETRVQAKSKLDEYDEHIQMTPAELAKRLHRLWSKTSPTREPETVGRVEYVPSMGSVQQPIKQTEYVGVVDLSNMDF